MREATAATGATVAGVAAMGMGVTLPQTRPLSTEPEPALRIRPPRPVRIRPWATSPARTREDPSGEVTTLSQRIRIRV